MTTQNHLADDGLLAGCPGLVIGRNYQYQVKAIFTDTFCAGEAAGEAAGGLRACATATPTATSTPTPTSIPTPTSTSTPTPTVTPVGVQVECQSPNITVNGSVVSYLADEYTAGWYPVVWYGYSNSVTPPTDMTKCASNPCIVTTDATLGSFLHFRANMNKDDLGDGFRYSCRYDDWWVRWQESTLVCGPSAGTVCAPNSQSVCRNSCEGFVQIYAPTPTATLTPVPTSTPTPIALLPTATLTPTPTSTPTNTPVPLATPTPAITIEQVISQWNPYVVGNYTADVNRDGVVDELDLGLVL
jgi:hypothetical protein